MKKVVILLLVLLAAFSFTLEAAKRNTPEGREYKILLKAQNFVSFNQGCELFWELVESVALDHSVKIKKQNKAYPQREICFIDTADFSLYKHGFMLRLRSEEVSAVEEIRLGKDAEMTLKFRASDFESVLIAPVKFDDKLFTGELSTEEDVVVKATAPVSVYSVSSTVYRPGPVPSDLSSLLKYYPDMKKAGFTGNAPLKTVNGIEVAEKRLRLGELKFGDEKVKTIFSAWYKKGQEKPFIAEFSFKVKLKDKNPARRIRSLEQIDRFFVDLVKRGKLFVALGQTKTGLIYQTRR